MSTYDKGLMIDDYTEESFLVVIENHLDILRNSPNTIRIPIEPALAYRFEYNFYNILRMKSVPYHLHRIVMRMNHRVSEFDSCKDLREILVPSEHEIDTLLSYHQSQRQIG